MRDSIAHKLGAVIKYFAALTIFVFSVSLSYTFFSYISPPKMPWFVWAALGLTEIGLLCWLAVFMMQRHHTSHKTLALCMIVVCFTGVLLTDAVELSRMFGVAVPIAGVYYYALIGLFAAHLLAFVVDLFIGYFSTNPFYGGSPQVALKSEPVRTYSEGYTGEQQVLAQTATVDKGPGLFARGTANLIAAVETAGELAAEKREKRKGRKPQVLTITPEEPVMVAEDSDPN